MLQCYIPLDITLLTMMGPLIYLYVLELLGTRIEFWSRRVFIHSLSVMPSIVYVFYFMILSKGERVHILQQNFKQDNWQTEFLTDFFLVQMSCYLIVCFSIVYKQLKKSHFVQVASVQVDICWLKTLFIIDLAIMAISIPVCLLIENDNINTIVALSALIIVCQDAEHRHIIINSACCK